MLHHHNIYVASCKRLVGRLVLRSRQAVGRPVNLQPAVLSSTNECVGVAWSDWKGFRSGNGFRKSLRAKGQGPQRDDISQTSPARRSNSVREFASGWDPRWDPNVSSAISGRIWQLRENSPRLLLRRCLKTGNQRQVSDLDCFGRSITSGAHHGIILLLGMPCPMVFILIIDGLRLATIRVNGELERVSISYRRLCDYLTASATERWGGRVERGRGHRFFLGRRRDSLIDSPPGSPPVRPGRSHRPDRRLPARRGGGPGRAGR